MHPSGWIGGTKSPYIEHLYAIGTAKDTSNFTQETLRYGMDQLAAVRDDGLLIPLIYGTKQHYLDTHKALQLSKLQSKKQFILKNSDKDEEGDCDALYSEYKRKFRLETQSKKEAAQAAIDATAEVIDELGDLIEEFQIWINFILEGNRYCNVYLYFFLVCFAEALQTLQKQVLM